MSSRSAINELKTRIETLLDRSDEKMLKADAGALADISQAFESQENSALQALWPLASRLVERLANEAKSEQARNELGEGDIVNNIASLLRLTTQDQTSFRIQSLRLLGNMCFDHDDNRRRVDHADVIPIVMPYLAADQNPDLIRTACGFSLNSSMDYVPIQAAITNNRGVGHLLALLDPARMDHHEEITVTFAAKVLENLVIEDATRPKLATKEVVTRVLQMVKYEWQVDQLENLDLLETFADILVQLVAEDDAMQITVLDSGFFDILLDFFEGAESPSDADDEDKKRLDEILKTFGKTIVYATSTDDRMVSLYNSPLLIRVIKWTNSNLDRLRECAVYILGNLARSDEHCTDLVNTHHLEVLLLDILRSTENATLQYAVLSCLKHLCLPKPNRSVIGNAGAIDVVSVFLETSKDLLKRNQFISIGILKLLCTTEFTNSKKIITETVNGSTPLQLVLAFLGRVDDVSAKSEATRILTNLIKSVWLQGVEESQALRRSLIQPEILKALQELTRTSKFIVLKNDGIIALSLIFAEGDSNSSKELLSDALAIVAAHAPPLESSVSEEQQEDQEDAKPETRSFFQVLADIASGHDDGLPNEVQYNACILIEKIASATRLVGNEQVRQELKSVANDRLKAVSTGDPTLATLARKALDAIDV